MRVDVSTGNYHWLCSGDEMFPAMLQAIREARRSVFLEVYIFAAGSLADQFREALVLARSHGATVRVLADALGSLNMPAAFWASLTREGVEIRQFNPLRLGRLGIRNHRKLLVCDDRVAFVGGFNISKDYEGNGVDCGWCDLGLKIEGPLAESLGLSFQTMFERAEFRHKRFLRLRRFRLRPGAQDEQLLFGGPEQHFNPIKQALRRDLAAAKRVLIMSAYFLPTWRLRRDLGRVARQGGDVQLILPGKTDVLLSQLAARSLYRRFLKAGVRIFEYQPQILHAKLFVIDDCVYIGSANMDHRSLNINYELMVRFHNREMAEQARQIFFRNRDRSSEISLESWRRGANFWRRLKQRWAYFVLARIDPYIARREWQALPD